MKNEVIDAYITTLKTHGYNYSVYTLYVLQWLVLVELLRCTRLVVFYTRKYDMLR